MTEPRDLPGPARDRFEEFPPSAKLVYLVLAHEEPLTQGQLETETRLSNRTVRYAIDQLRQAGFVQSELYIPDARKQLYRTDTPNRIQQSAPE